MGAFMKITALGVVVAGGSLLALGLAVVSVPLAFAALAVTAVLAVGVIVLIARDTRRLDRTPSRGDKQVAGREA